jgi:hypothetical protein
MRWWLRNLVVGGAAGFAVGLVVGARSGASTCASCFSRRTAPSASRPLAVALTALPVPWLLERLVPDPRRERDLLARGLLVTGMAAFVSFGVTGVAIAYSTPRPF